MNERGLYLLLAASAGVVGYLLFNKSSGYMSSQTSATKDYTVPNSGKPYLSWFYAAENDYSLPRNLLVRMAQQESNFNPNAVSPAGALGMMQIVPSAHPDISKADILDPYKAINYAAKYMRQLYNQFGSWALALAAYNWGPGNLKKYGISNAPAETVAYVKNISSDVEVA